ncbi:hypothetical protein C7S18_02200 [Ahniella affigens]|uniref:Thiol:disulfide interchange protein DsbD N-terminal domain-containing protein n=1 Tax=Ahniella affigens TaxID=2021234 RepID=A0A2P1PMK8_9GAMM|nr:protein-disulfide reductase DsbD domain-containing protein [Ahniella affigens]AVP96075.1 hypothetical protein C7S18_02200 [Ahniella affigens]
MNVRWLLNATTIGLVAGGLNLFGSSLAMAAEVPTLPVRAELIAAVDHALIGGGMTIGLRLQHVPHWHSYWRNPGDSGMVTNITWKLPEGVRVSEFSWPAPKRFVFEGLDNFGYGDDLLLPMRLSVDPAVVGTDITIEGTAKWLACESICIPGKAELSLRLPLTKTVTALRPNAAAKPLFDQARMMQPLPVAAVGSANVTDAAVRVRLPAAELPDVARLDAFVEERALVMHKPAAMRRDGNELVLQFDRSEYFSAAPEQMHVVLTDATTKHAWRFQAPISTSQP